jgi:hypothetical protein
MDSMCVREKRLNDACGFNFPQCYDNFIIWKEKNLGEFISEKSWGLNLGNSKCEMAHCIYKIRYWISKTRTGKCGVKTNLECQHMDRM